ncbi:hypothetical protein Arad_8455 [Rhizobium rhizogenes K84]|uniref:Uncharacterized protein n=1 Tax=Rhizobium rhizogenes (strain K84 / ATCC BAA-868) TaxID=311403 RepID=B9JII4_RHIR8|nr:hypothetical protein Arad_8455 [Rhizobium rhizogenes K84]
MVWVRFARAFDTSDVGMWQRAQSDRIRFLFRTDRSTRGTYQSHETIAPWQFTCQTSRKLASFSWKIPAGSDADIEPPNEDKWPDGTERDQRGRLRQALIFLLNESKFLGYTKVAKHLRRAIDALR